MYMCFYKFLQSHNRVIYTSYVKFSHVEKGLVNGINTNTYTLILGVHTAVWFLTLPKCFYESFVVMVYGLG